MTRRNLLIALGVVAVAPRAVLAQSKQPVLIGWLHGDSRESNADYLTVFMGGLAALGWKESSQFVIEERWADGRINRLPSLAVELAAKKPAVIVTGPSVGVAAAATKAASGTPIVYIGGDPVAPGLAASLARPGGMVTGVTNFSIAISEKYLELLLAAAPTLQRIGFLLDLNAANYVAHLANARRSVALQNVEARFAEIARTQEIEPALSRLAKEGVQALVVMPSTIGLLAERRRIVKFALDQRWPVISTGGSAEAGALLSYWPDNPALYRRAAYYVDRILKGAKPGDLPIEQPAKFELVVNLRTAKALGLTIPQAFLMRADRVIE